MAESRINANKDAEQSILGAVFYDESTIRLLIDKLSVKDFYYLRHKEIYQAMVDLYNQNVVIDPTTVISMLEDRGKLNDCGGTEYILALTEAVPSISNVDAYIDIVKDKSIQRNIVQVCNDIIQESNGDIEDIKAFLDNAEQKIYNATRERSTNDMVGISSVLDQVAKKIQENAARDGEIIGLNTGYEGLNRLTLGFQAPDLIILAARPAMGKTAFALNLAANIASLPKHPYVAFFSLEMGVDQLALRLISQKSNISQTALKTGKFNDENAWNRINFAISELQKCNILLDDSGVVNVQDLRTLCRKKKSEGKLDIVFIDYLQLLSSRSNKASESRVQEISEITRTLKEMARELQVPVVALSQLSRQLENRPDKRPIMADLRESGSIEQDADFIMCIYRDEVYNKDKEDNKNLAEINVIKNRNGMIGGFNLVFRGECTNFIDMDSEVSQE